MKVSDLSGQALDFWVARAEGQTTLHTMDGKPYVRDDKPGSIPYEPSTDWSQGGPIIEREGIGTSYVGGLWTAIHDRPDDIGCGGMAEHNVYTADTPLVAAMRCFVAAKFGEEVPDENLP